MYCTNTRVFRFLVKSKVLIRSKHKDTHWMSDTLTYFLSGGFGGICTVLVGHPLDTVKVRLQTMPTPKPGEKPQYTGTLDCLKKTIASEGVAGLYKGMAAPLAAVAPIFAISFLGYGVGKKLFSSSEEKGTPWQYFAAGGVAGFFTTFVMSPGERIKSLLQVQKGEREKLYNGPLDCAVKLYKQGGIRSIYKGSVATLMRDVPASGLYYLTYDCIKDVLTEGGKTDMGIAGAIFAGGMAGVTHWAIGMPADVIKSRLQTAPEGSFPNGARDVIKDLLKKEGPLAFYKGITPVLLRAFPANAACFAGFEVCQQFLRKLFSS